MNQQDQDIDQVRHYKNPGISLWNQSPHPLTGRTACRRAFWKFPALLHRQSLDAYPVNGKAGSFQISENQIK